MDEGDRASASVREWQQQQTFCFLDNATLRVRLDELNRWRGVLAARALEDKGFGVFDKNRWTARSSRT